MRGRPPIIVWTMVLGVINLIVWSMGLPRNLYVPLNGINAWMSGYEAWSSPTIFNAVIRLLLMPALACVALYAGVRRPAWERPAFRAYALLLYGIMLVNIAVPQLQTLPSNAAEHAGYVMGQWFFGSFSLYWIYRMWLGARARQYFDNRPVADSVALATIEDIKTAC